MFFQLIVPIKQQILGNYVYYSVIHTRQISPKHHL